MRATKTEVTRSKYTADYQRCQTRIQQTLRKQSEEENYVEIGLIHVCLYACLCVHLTAETLDGVAELSDTQTALQTDVKETY